MQLILQTEPTADIKTKMSALGETLARSQISAAISNMEDDICALNKTSSTIVQDSKQSSKHSEITLNNEQLENIINDIDSISKTNGDVVNKEQKLESELEIDTIIEKNVENVSNAHDQSNGKLTSTESFQRASNLADNVNLTELLENSKGSIVKDSADTVCVKHEEKGLIELNFENKSEVTSMGKDITDNINIESSPAILIKLHNEKHSDGNPSQDISSENGNIEGSIGDQSMVPKEAAFSPNSETNEKDFNISAQLKHLKEDSLMDGNPSKTFVSDDDMNSPICEEAKKCEKAISTVLININDPNASKDNEQENVVDRGQKLNEQKNEIVESEISNEKSLVDHKDQLPHSEKEFETTIDKNLKVSVDHLPEKVYEGKMNVQVLKQEIINDILSEDESQKEKDLVSVVHVEQQSVESVTVVGCMEVDNNSISTQDSPIGVDNADNVDKMSLVQKDIISEDNIDKPEHISNIIKNVEASGTIYLEKLPKEDNNVQQIEETMDVDEFGAISSSEIPDNAISENIISEIQSVEKASVLENNINMSEATPEKDTAKDSEDHKVLNDKEQVSNDQNHDEIAMESDDIEVIKNTNNNSDFAVEKDLIQNVREINEIIKDQDADIKITNKEDETQNCNLVNSDSKNDDVHKAISIYDNVKEPIVENQTKLVSDVEIMDEEDIQNIEETHKIEVEEDKITERQLPVVCKLSNTMDILSEDEDQDEDDPPTDNKISELKTDTQEENKFINIDDDDDIMFIEDTEDSKVKSSESGCETQTESEINDENENTNSTENCAISPVGEMFSNISDNKDEVKNSEIDQQDLVDTKPVEANDKESNSPIVTKTFLKSVIKNLAEMTRNELEDFCVLKLVESIVDNGNLKEIKEKMLTMSRIIEDLKKRSLLLMKQNRDLQVVIKTVEENQKNVNPVPILPMKITRSVGMQVVLTSAENNANLGMKKKSPIRPVRNMLSPKAQKPVVTNIPVPRLVPASSPNTKIIPPVNNIAKPVALVRTPPARPEKRPHNRLSPASSMTVDLTDDEPPTKVSVAQRNPAPPVRVVPSQSLMPVKQRPQFGPAGNSQRKVYIPISGAQANGLRPGTNFMKNFVQTPISRARTHTRMPNRMNHGNRHPAPLPDAMKQYQPPTWKALPPAPDLKLSKVDNGIVISWKFEGYQTETYEEVASFQLYAYQETSAPPSTALWKKIGDIKALPLPMACTLTQFISGFKYYFAVRAVDVRSRIGPFSLPGSIMLLCKS